MFEKNLFRESEMHRLLPLPHHVQTTLPGLLGVLRRNYNLTQTMQAHLVMETNRALADMFVKETMEGSMRVLRCAEPYDCEAETFDDNICLVPEISFMSQDRRYGRAVFTLVYVDEKGVPDIYHRFGFGFAGESMIRTLTEDEIKNAIIDVQYKSIPVHNLEAVLMKLAKEAEAA